MIPKILHCIWVGGNEKPDLVKRCMASWRRHLPDYRIMEWDDAAHETVKTPFSEGAYKAGKWAFVSDYLRLHALHTHGGIYLDTDVEILDSLDAFLEYDFFSGYERYNGAYSPITPLMGAVANNAIIGDLLKYYRDAASFEPERKVLVPNTKRIGKYFEERFRLFPPYDGTRTTMLDGRSVLFPSHYFCAPVDNEKSYAIHHFNESWADAYTRRDKFTIGKFTLSRFRPWGGEGHPLPLAGNEEIVLWLRITGTYRLVLIREK